ncbi:MAG: GntR family transcriptional regulator [Actinobacteria bacterium]|nr:MAG: GntR family transcriptional regulator [Actinomycetota bacterium]
MAAQIDLSVDRDSEVPLGTQLGWTLRTLIRTGRLAPGTRLPGVRELAEQAGVHVNTVRAVYSRLEDEGLVTSQHGRGTFVAAGAAERAELDRVLTAAAAEASSAGVDPRELAAALFVAGGWGPRDAGPGSAERRGRAKGEPDDAGGEPTGAQRPPATRRAGGAGEPETPAAPQGERARRRRLRQEIAELEGELGYLEPLAPATEPPRLPAGRILTAAELEEVRDRLVGRVVELREARAEARRRALEPPAPEVAPARAGREWGHGGVWTGGRVRTASFGA